MSKETRPAAESFSDLSDGAIDAFARLDSVADTSVARWSPCHTGLIRSIGVSKASSTMDKAPAVLEVPYAHQLLGSPAQEPTIAREMMLMVGPLDGYRVIDMTAYVAGPYAGQLLGDLGADVIKLEPPKGDETRERGKSRSSGMGPSFMNLNRNKRSVALNLKDDADRQRFYGLVRSSDVFLHNMRPQAVARLGASCDDLCSIREALVYCQIVGFGTGGPYEGRPAFDDIIQGVSGFAAMQGEFTGEPRYSAFPMMDNIAGLFAAKSILAALLHRERTGEGQAIEIPMFETGAAFVMIEHMWERTYEPDGALGYPRNLAPDRKPFKTRDGYFCMVLATDRQFRCFFVAAGQPELSDDPRFANSLARSINAKDLYAVMGELFAKKTTAEWAQVVDEVDLPGMAMNRMEDLL